MPDDYISLHGTFSGNVNKYRIMGSRMFCCYFTLHRNKASEEQEEIMITINKVEDVPVFLGCIALTEHLKDKVKQMLTTFETDNLEPYGSIYVIQFESDWNISTEIGLVEPLKDTPVEFAEIHTLDNGHGGTIDVFHGCFCLSNDYSFDVYCPMYLMDEKAFYEWVDNLVGGKK